MADQGKVISLDESATYWMSGKTLKRICKAVNQWENLTVIWGPASGTPAITKAESKSILTIPQWSSSSESTAQFLYPFAVSYDATDEEGQILSTTASYLHDDYVASASVAITGLNDAFSMGSDTHAWIEISVSELAVTSAELMTGSAFPDLIETSGSPAVQTKYNLPVGRVVSDSQPGMPGFDFSLGAPPVAYHWQQLLREHQITSTICFSGTPALVSAPWQGI